MTRHPVPPPGPREELAQQGMITLFEDEKFSGDLLSKLFKLGMCEEDMDAIFKRAEDEIWGFVGALSDSGAGREAQSALNGFISRLKKQILDNPQHYVEGS